MGGRGTWVRYATPMGIRFYKKRCTNKATVELGPCEYRGEPKDSDTRGVVRTVAERFVDPVVLMWGATSGLVHECVASFVAVLVGALVGVLITALVSQLGSQSVSQSITSGVCALLHLDPMPSMTFCCVSWYPVGSAMYSMAQSFLDLSVSFTSFAQMGESRKYCLIRFQISMQRDVPCFVDGAFFPIACCRPPRMCAMHRRCRQWRRAC